jgi:GntR family transcriptional regulator, transcriptional repressor for pyruvate dehydrogenase complex
VRNDKLNLDPGDASNVRIVQGIRLGDHLYQAILTMIDRQKMAEGARLPPENDLATLFGVSRPTVRETLSRLRDDGVIISRRGSGSYVSRRDGSHEEMSDVTFDRIDSFEQIQKCYEFRKAIEGEACFLAATRHTPALFDRIEAACAVLGRDVDDGRLGNDSDFDFHLSIARGTGNEWFASALAAMRSQIEFSIEIARSLTFHRSLHHLQTVQGEHVAVLEALRVRDGERAREAMRDHLTKTCNRIFRGPITAPPD